MSITYIFGHGPIFPDIYVKLFCNLLLLDYVLVIVAISNKFNWKSLFYFFTKQPNRLGAKAHQSSKYTPENHDKITTNISFLGAPL